MNFRATCVAAAAAMSMSACTLVVGGRAETCGEHPSGGGPAVISTRDQELCELVRIRVGKELDDDASLNYEKIDGLLEKCGGWERKDTIEDLVAALRRDAGDHVADAVRRAVDAVLAQSKRPMPTACPDEQKCLVKGAVKGVKIALSTARPWSNAEVAPPPDAPPAKK